MGMLKLILSVCLGLLLCLCVIQITADMYSLWRHKRILRVVDISEHKAYRQILHWEFQKGKIVKLLLGKCLIMGLFVALLRALNH
jgi:hypothetical protein